MSKHGSKDECKEDPLHIEKVISSAFPKNIPSAPNRHETITLMVPTNIGEDFQGNSAIFLRGNAADNTATGTIDDNQDGTMILNAVFNSTQAGILAIRIVGEKIALQSGPNAMLTIG